VLELARLTFVPPGSTSPWVLPEEDSVGVDEALLVDRFELRRRDAVALGLGLPTERGWSSDHGDWLEAGADLPACLDLAEARRLAEARGMRLPTASEWLYVAGGRTGHRYPWGRIPQRSVANTLELELLEPLPVGAFESGRGPFGTYDQVGNVWEWVEVEGSPDLGRVLGGSYLDRTRPLWEVNRGSVVPLVFFGREQSPVHRAPDVGARCVAPAGDWIWQRGLELGHMEGAAAARVRRVGEDWVATGEAAFVELLEELADREGAPELVTLLLQGASR